MKIGLFKAVFFAEKEVFLSLECGVRSCVLMKQKSPGRHRVYIPFCLSSSSSGRLRPAERDLKSPVASKLWASRSGATGEGLPQRRRVDYQDYLTGGSSFGPGDTEAG
jgi:hypothetical protein